MLSLTLCGSGSNECQSLKNNIVNSAALKIKIMNEMDRLPLVVFPSIFSLSENNILYLNSK